MHRLLLTVVTSLPRQGHAAHMVATEGVSGTVPVVAEALSDEERAGRKRRLRIIIGVAVALVAVGGIFTFYVDRRADEAQTDLRRRLEAASATVDHEEVLDAWYQFLTNPDAPDRLDEVLPTENRIALRAEGETVVAVYKAGFASQDRCFDFFVGADRTEIDERSC